MFSGVCTAYIITMYVLISNAWATKIPQIILNVCSLNLDEILFDLIGVSRLNPSTMFVKTILVSKFLIDV